MSIAPRLRTMKIVRFAKTPWKQGRRHEPYWPVVTAFIGCVLIAGFKKMYGARHAVGMCGREVNSDGDDDVYGPFSYESDDDPVLSFDRLFGGDDDPRQIGCSGPPLDNGMGLAHFHCSYIESHKEREQEEQEVPTAEGEEVEAIPSLRAEAQLPHGLESLRTRRAQKQYNSLHCEWRGPLLRQSTI